MKIFQPKNKAGFTLVEIMIVVLIIGILLAIAIPNFVAARESSRAKACIGNLKQIDSAVQQYCMDKKLNSSSYSAGKPTIDTTVGTGLVGAASYLRTQPSCPSTGIAFPYVVPVAITDSPSCSISGNATNSVVTTGSGTGTDYSVAGAKFYHGL